VAGPSRLSNWDSVEKQIEKGEGKIQKRQECMNAVKRKVLVRIHFIIVMIGWTGLAPEAPGMHERRQAEGPAPPCKATLLSGAVKPSSSSLLLSSLELSDTKVCEPVGVNIS